MKAGDTVFVIGSAGAITKMDVPRDVHRRERFDLDLEKGALRLVDPGDVVADPHPRWPDSVRYVLREGASAAPAVPAVQPVASEPSDPSPDERPVKSAGKAAWVDFAVAQGMDREAAEAMTKDELVEQFGG